MRKSLQEMAQYYKANILENLPDDYPIDGHYLNGFTETEIRVGIKAFQKVLHSLFDYVSGNYEAMEQQPTINKNKYKQQGGFADEYPVFNSLLRIFYHIGLMGKAVNSSEPHLIVNGSQLYKELKAIRVKKINECLNHLSVIGFDFGGINIQETGFNLANYDDIAITYPDNPAMIPGYKALAAANAVIQRNGMARPREVFSGPVNQIFFRCSYPMLRDTGAKEPLYTLSECLGSLTGANKLFLTDLDRLLTNTGCKCDIRFINLRFTGVYTHKKSKSVLFTLYIDPEGLTVKVNADTMDKYADFISSLPQRFSDVLVNGQHCGKTAGVDTCSPKCKAGFTFELNGTVYSKCRGLNFTFRIDDDESRRYVKEFVEYEANARE